MNNIEISFSYRIDCNLNYYKLDQLLSQFEESKSISSSSIYRFLEELFCAPVWQCKSKILNRNIEFMLNYIYRSFEHPLKDVIFTAGISKLNNTLLPPKKGLIYLKMISKYQGHYAALNIVEGSCKRNNWHILIEQLYHKIIKEWANNAIPNITA